MSTRTHESRVYVLLLNWRGWEDTIECLESVFRQEYGDYRVVVCDNASGDDSLARIRAWARGELEPGSGLPIARAELVPKPMGFVEYDREEAEEGGAVGDDFPLVLIQTGENLGFAGGNNVGLRYILARGDAEYVWILNNDTVVDRTALNAMVQEAARSPGAGMVGSKLLYYDAPDVIQTAGGGRLIRWQGRVCLLGRDQRDEGQWDCHLSPDHITGASLLVRVGAIRDVGLFDEGYFMYSEDVDWCLRVRQKGWTLSYAPQSRVWHKEGKSLGTVSTVRDYYGVRSTLALVRKFFPELLPVAFLYSLYQHTLPKLLRLESGRLRATLRAYRDFFRRIEGRTDVGF